MQVTLIAIVIGVVLLSSDVTSGDNEDDWLDPNDMVNFDHSNMRMKNKPDQKIDGVSLDIDKLQKNAESHPKDAESESHVKTNEKKKTKEFVSGAAEKQEMCRSCPTAIPLMKEFTKTLLKHLDYQNTADSDTFDLRAYLSRSDINTLRRFALKEGNLMDAHDVLKGMIQFASVPISPSSSKEWMEEKLGISLRIILEVLGICTLAVSIIYLEVKLNISWKKKIIKLCVLLFFFSVPWTWYELYKKEEIKQHAAVMKNAPRECLQKESEMGYYHMTVSVLQSWFSLKEDKCHAYYEHVLIDPMWKVTPTQAFAVTFVRFFVSPLKYIGEAVSQFLVGMLKDLPVQLWPVAGLFVSVFLFLLLFMGFGYRIRLPLISVEPTPLEGKNTKLEALLEEKCLKQIEELKVSMKSINHNIEQITYEESHKPVTYSPAERALTSDDVVRLFNKLSDAKRMEDSEKLAITNSTGENVKGEGDTKPSAVLLPAECSVDTISANCDDSK